MSKKQLLRRLAVIIVPPVAALLMRAIYATLRVRYEISGEWPQHNCVVVGWHGELFVNPVFYSKFRRGFDSYAMVSHHFDGELIARTFYLATGVKSIRGSSKKGARAVLVQAIKKIKEGSDVILTPDGPRGPRHKFQSGALAIAKRARNKLVIITARPEKYWRLNSWDRFMIPKPFSKILFKVQVVDLEELDQEHVDDTVEEMMLRHAV